MLTRDRHASIIVRMTITTGDDENGQIPMLTLGWRLRMALDFAGLSVQEMADVLELSRTTLSSWMNDRGALPRKIFLKEWSLKTGVDYQWLVTGTARSRRPDGPNDGVSSECTARDSNPEPAASQLQWTNPVIPLPVRRAA